ncbi:hypothetical protein HON22_02025, partial [Candidatus Peregrinibacteria bacterium]|nr:hypothetical protein [Candidatus Peregrinibacteria bacterium]
MKKANIHVSSQKIKKSQTDLKKLDALMKDDSLIDISNHEEITEKDIPYLEITLPEKKSERMSLRCTPSIKKF